jgi:hypothetical protein
MTKHLCQGPECHTYKTQSRIRGTKGAKVLRTRFARCDVTPEHRSFWEDYFCDERCLHAWLKVHLNNLMLSVGINTKPNETPIDSYKGKLHETIGKEHTYRYNYKVIVRTIDTMIL